VGGVEAAVGGLTGSGDGVAVASGVAASATGGVTVSEDGVTVAAGSVTDAARFADSLR
jgi:hypothetical protein